MFQGKVKRSFVDRITKARYPVGSTYQADSEQRMREIVEAGKKRGVVYVDWDLPEGVDGRDSLEEMTVAELRSYAEGIGLELKATKKADIIAEIKAAEGD